MIVNESHYNVIVAGVGTMGSAICWQLASRGRNVLGLDRFGTPNAMASHHGRSRAIRLAYFEHPGYTPLLRRAYELWRGLETTSGESLLTICGGLYAGPAGGSVAPDSISAAQLHGVEHEVLSVAETARRFPQFALPEGTVAMYEPQAGVLRPEASIAAMAQLATAAGAQLSAPEQLLRWESDGSTVHVTTDRGAYSAEQLVLCPGPYAAGLLQLPGVSVTATRQAVGWYEPAQPALCAPDSMPLWAFETAEREMYYGFGIIGDAPGAKVGRHVAGPPVDPLEEKRVATAGEAVQLLSFIEQWLPAVAGPLTELSVCIYENSPDGHFILDRHPRCDNVVIAAGFSGHGFKFAPVIGELVAQLAVDGRTSLDTHFLSLSRFA